MSCPCQNLKIIWQESLWPVTLGDSISYLLPWPKGFKMGPLLQFNEQRSTWQNVPFFPLTSATNTKCATRAYVALFVLVSSQSFCAYIRGLTVENWLKKGVRGMGNGTQQIFGGTQNFSDKYFSALWLAVEQGCWGRHVIFFLLYFRVYIHWSYMYVYVVLCSNTGWNIGAGSA